MITRFLYLMLICSGLISFLFITELEAGNFKNQKTSDDPSIQDVELHKKHPLYCSQYPNASICYKFTNPKSVDALFPKNVFKGCSRPPMYDDVEKAGKLTVASKCGANSSGLFHFDWERHTDDLWLQFRVKIENGLIKKAKGYGLPSWKLFVLWEGDASCSQQEFAGTNGYYRGFVQFYEACGSYGYKKNNPTGDNPSNYDMQPGGDTHCFYKWRGRETKPCFEYKPKWATYTFYLDLDGASHNGVPTVIGWGRYDGERQYKILEFPLKKIRAASHVYFGPYMTYKKKEIAHPEWTVWYQDILVTRKPLIKDWK